MRRCVRLEAAAEEVCNQSAVPPLIFQLPPAQGRKILEELQDAPVYKYPADIASGEVDTGDWGSIPVYFIAPQNAAHIERGLCGKTPLCRCGGYGCSDTGYHS